MNTLLKQLFIFTLAVSLSACASQSQESNDQRAEESEVKEQPSRLIVADAENDTPQLSQLASSVAVRETTNRAQLKAKQLAEHSIAIHRPTPLPAVVDISGENYAKIDWNSIKEVLKDPVSTFSIDVDTGAYSNVRRMLQQGMLPPKDAVRTEELLNYFDYNYQSPDSMEAPFLVNSSLMQSPWNNDKHLLQIGIKAWEQPQNSQRPAVNLVFLVDVSGSMNQANKLPLLKQSLRLLSKQMTAADRISIVVYAGASGVVLEPTAGNNTLAIERAFNSLQAGGSTYGEAGIKLAYQMAEQAFITDGVNRILLATDGDFNVGQTSTDALINLIEQKRKKGIALSTLGFGAGNYNDHLMEQLANHGNGSYSYIDNLLEARKVLVDELDSQLITVAKDVKLQLEFNPQHVAEYRLIGYENRTLAREDFNNDTVDAGEIGAGHTVTAVYELTLVNSQNRSITPLRYQQSADRSLTSSDELGFMRIRYKAPDAENSQLIETPLIYSTLMASSESPDHDSQFSAAVVAFADKLQGGKHTSALTFNAIEQMVANNKGADPAGLRAEFQRLIRLAETLLNNS